MKYIIILTLLLFSTVNVSAQESKVKLALDISNSFMNCFTTGRFFNLTTASVGIDFKSDKGNIQVYGVYGFNTNLILPSDRKYGKRNFSLKSNLLGTSIKFLFLTENKTFRPFVSVCFLSEYKSNYFNDFIDPLTYTLRNSHAIKLHGLDMYNYATFYQSTPLIFNIDIGCSFHIIENFRLNLSIGYSLSVLNYKYAEWTDDDIMEEMIKQSPLQKKILHSITGQIGLNYTFSFKKQPKTVSP